MDHISIQQEHFSSIPFGTHRTIPFQARDFKAAAGFDFSETPFSSETNSPTLSGLRVFVRFVCKDTRFRPVTTPEQVARWTPDSSVRPYCFPGLEAVLNSFLAQAKLKDHQKLLQLHSK